VPHAARESFSGSNRPDEQPHRAGRRRTAWSTLLAVGAIGVGTWAAWWSARIRPYQPSIDAAEIATLTDRAYDVYDQLTAIAEARPADCPGAASEMQAVVNRHRALLRRAIAVSGEPALLAAHRDVLLARQARATALARRMERAFARCTGDPAMRRVLRQID
jgi:hypothetical protein